MSVVRQPSAPGDEPPPMPEADRHGVSSTALDAFFAIAGLWDLSRQDQITLLAAPDSATFDCWKGDYNAALTTDTITRISHILKIYEALHVLLPSETVADGLPVSAGPQDAADTWVKRPNKAPLFAGQSALHRMLSGRMADLQCVRQYLVAQCGGAV